MFTNLCWYFLIYIKQFMSIQKILLKYMQVTSHFEGLLKRDIAVQLELELELEFDAQFKNYNF